MEHGGLLLDTYTVYTPAAIYRALKVTVFIPVPDSRVENLSPAMGRGIDSRNRV